MAKKIKYLGIIPARGGSKGIPKKNIILFGGKPLIAFTIEAALGSSSIDHCFLSSDSDEIIDVAEKLGIQSDYKRPFDLATDEAGAVDVVLDVLRHLKCNEVEVENLVYLQPTSPLRTSLHIDEAISLFEKEGSDSLLSVHEMTEHPCECVAVRKNGWNLLEKSPNSAVRRQDYQNKYAFINGAIYIAKVDFFLKRKAFFEEGNSSLYWMSPDCGIDIDEPVDLKKAEFFLKELG